MGSEKQYVDLEALDTLDRDTPMWGIPLNDLLGYVDYVIALDDTVSDIQWLDNKVILRVKFCPTREALVELNRDTDWYTFQMTVERMAYQIQMALEETLNEYATHKQ